MMSLIEQQVWLAQGEYVKVIAHSEGLLRRCEAMHYGLVGLQARIQLAAAQLRFGQRAEARATLAAALLDAVQDDFWVLFVEQYPALAPLLEGEDWAVCELRLGPFVARILPAGRAFAARLGLRAPAPAPELPLTDRDRELAQAAQWAIEQGYLKARADGSFKPDKGVAKWRVIRGYRAVTEP